MKMIRSISGNSTHLSTPIPRISALRPYLLLGGFGALLVILLAASGFGQDTVPAHPVSPFEAADRLLKEHKPGEALELLLPMAGKDPKAAGVEQRLGQAYFEKREYAQAIAHSQTALQQNPGDLQAEQWLALSFFSAGNFREALPLLEKLGPQLPNDSPDSASLLSVCYVMTQQPDRARKELAEMFGVPEDSAMAYLALAKLMVRQGMVDAAKPQIGTALKLQPRLLMAHFLMGEIDLYQSQPQDAVAEFQRELSIDPTLWLVYWRLGDAYVRVGNYDEAEKVLKEAVWLNDGSSAALVLLGEIAIKKNDPALGAGFLERALALDPQNADAHDLLSSAYQDLGRGGEATQQAEAARKLRMDQHKNGEDILVTVPAK